MLMKQIKSLVIAACIQASMFCGSGLLAYDLPPVNLGLTSFLDGGPPAGPGFYFTEYGQYYHASRLNDTGGRELFPKSVFPNQKLDVWASLSQFIYQSDQKILLGGKWGLDVIVPVVRASIRNTPLSNNGVGLGDVLVGPFLQWDPIMGQNGPRFMHRIELQTMFPTGRFDPTRQLNPGSDIYSFNPYWSATYFATPKCSISTRIHYLWNSENDQIKHQPGQAVHLNFASEYMLIENHLRIGFNGYWLSQISDSKQNGASVAGRERVFAIGPGLLYSINQNNHIFFNAYFETVADNRPKGYKLVLRFVHHF